MKKGSTDTAASAEECALACYLREEGERLREEARAQGEAEVRRIREHSERELAAVRASGQAEIAALRNGVKASIIGRAESNAEAVMLRKTGDAVDDMLEACREKCRAFMGTDDYPAVFEGMLLEAVALAAELNPGVSSGSGLGQVLVAASDESLCRKLVDRHGLALDLHADDSVWGGIEIIVAGTTYRIRNTFASRMEKKDTELRSHATKRLKALLEEHFSS